MGYLLLGVGGCLLLGRPDYLVSICSLNSHIGSEIETSANGASQEVSASALFKRPHALNPKPSPKPTLSIEKSMCMCIYIYIHTHAYVLLLFTFTSIFILKNTYTYLYIYIGRHINTL